MTRSYSVVSPSLGGVLNHEALAYDGVRRPSEVLRVLDGPAADPDKPKGPYENRILEQYFYDLYGVFMKRLSEFVLHPAVDETACLKLQAILQEMIKIKKLMSA